MSTSRHPFTSRRRFIGQLAGVGGMAAAWPAAVQAGEPEPAGRGQVSVRSHGAKADGVSLDTKALQAAIDACASAGGGTVFFPRGKYLSGTLFLKSRVRLCLDAGATLLGSRDLADYPPTVSKVRSYTDNYTERSLIYGEDLEGVAMEGQGTIDGQGAAFKGPYKVRPYLIRVIASRGVSLRDLTIKDSPMWVQHYLACDDVYIDGITVRSRCNDNNDGIDIDGCHQVRISNCNIDSGDDAIVLKSTLDRPCRNVTITNCVLSSACNAFKLGTESNGGFQNIVLSNCVIHDTGIAGLAIELVDGGRLERVAITNVVMERANGVIFVRLGNRARPYKEGMAPPQPGSLSEVSISHVRAVGANRIGCSITGLPNLSARDISLDDIHIKSQGGVKEEEAPRTVEERAAQYPEYSMFGVLPAYGFYCRHVKGLRLRDIRVEVERPDARPALVCDDVEDLDLVGLRAAGSRSNQVMRLSDVRRAMIQGCLCPEDTPVYLRVEGASSRRIKLLANDLELAASKVELAPEVSAAAVTQ